MESSKNKYDWYSIIAFLLIAFCFAWIVSVFFLDLPEYHDHGDAFGGMTAPIIGFVSSILIYLSFRAQIDANKQVQKELDNNRQQANFEYMRQERDKLSIEINNFTFPFSGGFHKGMNGYTNLIDWTHHKVGTSGDVDFDSLERAYHELNLLSFNFLYYTKQIFSLTLSKEQRKILGVNIYLSYEKTMRQEVENALKVYSEENIIYRHDVDEKIKVVMNQQKQIHDNMMLFRQWLHEESEPKDRY
jgi:hypothetical protein